MDILELMSDKTVTNDMTVNLSKLTILRIVLTLPLLLPGQLSFTCQLVL
jgi:hypothetical protein